MKTDGQESKSDKLKRIVSRKIIPAIRRIVGTVPNELEVAIIQHSRISTVVKDQFIEESGQADDGHLIYFESGIARCYYYDAAHDKYVVTRITRKDEGFLDTSAYLHGSYRPENIQMLESGTVVTVTYPNLKLLLSEFPELNKALLHLAAELVKQHSAYRRLLKLTVEDRVRIFLDNNPGITTRINNGHIASYLDMNRTTFSTAYTRYRALKGSHK